MSPIRAALPALLLAAAVPVSAQTPPPPLLSYQGVLRDAADEPRNGSFDMVFRFYDAASGGNELLVDSQLSSSAQAVTVSNGLFDVVLGGGTVTDGSGAGTYTSLDQVFRDFAAVWLQIEVGPPNGARETLTPRTRVLAAAYAQNAARVEGFAGADLVQTRGIPQTKFGPLTLNAQGTSGDALSGIQQGSFGALGRPGIGVYGQGTDAAAQFVSSGLQEARCDVGSRSYFSIPIALDCWVDNGQTGAPAARFQELGPAGADSSALLGQYGIGVRGRGASMAADFASSAPGTWGQAYLGYGDFGIDAYGAFPNGAAGHFADSLYTGVAYLGIGDTGIVARGAYQGGEFQDTSSGNYARVGYDAWKIYGTGSVSFVQNHPQDPSKVVVYTAPEGAETATYTRGSGRLRGGVARVALDPTFAWTTNPDVGLTANVTARAASGSLYVESISTSELVVRCAGGECLDVPFDYLVWGLRVGFEEVGPVRPKDRDASIPAMDAQRAIYAKDPSLRAYNAFERFRGATGASPDLSRAKALRDAVGVFVPEGGARERTREVASATAPAPALERVVFPAGSLPVAVGEPVEGGDVLAIDPGRPGNLVRSTQPADRAVSGIVAGEAGRTWIDEAPLAFAGTIVNVKADATTTPIAVGDLLVASSIAGHAMRAPDGAAAGSIVAKALEPLAGGTGTIRILVMSR